MLFLWWAHWMRPWSFEACAITQSTLKPLCPGRTAVSQRGENVAAHMTFFSQKKDETFCPLKFCLNWDIDIVYSIFLSSFFQHSPL